MSRRFVIHPAVVPLTPPQTGMLMVRLRVGVLFEWITLTLASMVVVAVVVDALRLPVHALSTMLGALVIVALLAIVALRQRNAQPAYGPLWHEWVLLGVVIAVGTHLLLPAWPALLPIGNSPDAVHHTALANYIFEQHTLVRNPQAQSTALREMAVYPPGFAIVTATIAQLSGTLPVYVIYPLAALAVCASVAGTTLVGAETAAPAYRPLAAAAGLAVLLSAPYTLGAVASENYYAQVWAHWLIIAVGYSVLQWVRQPHWSCDLRIGLLLLALLWSYTTWLPVALLTVMLGVVLADRAELSVRRWLRLGALLGPIVALALVYGWARAGTGTDVVAHEGSTIREPLRVFGLILPGVALIGLGCGWRCTQRRVGLALIGAALVQAVALGVLWQRGAIAGYIYFKSYYLVALLLPIPIGWFAADSVGWLARGGAGVPSITRWLQPIVAGGAIVAALAVPLLVPSSDVARPITRPLVDAARWIKQHDLASKTAFALQQPGLPAYWLRVGALGRPRTHAAQALLDAPPLQFLDWYFDPGASRVLLFEGSEPPAEHVGLAVRYQNSCCIVLEKTAEYAAALEQRDPLLVSYRAYMGGGVQWITAHVVDHQSVVPLQLRLLINDGSATAATYTLDVPRDPTRSHDLIFTLDPATLAATAFVNDNPVGDMAQAPTTIPAHGTLRLQLVAQGAIVREQQIGTCCADGTPTIEQPSGTWAYAKPLPGQAPLTVHDYALGDQIDLIGSRLSHTVARPGETVDVLLRWRAAGSLPQPYRAFVQLIAQDGGAAVGVDGEPGQGAAPTWRWQAGDSIDDAWHLALPADLTPGTYQVVVGMYAPDTQQRLEAWQRSPHVERFWTDALPLGSLVVEP